MQKITTAALLLALFTAAPAAEQKPDLELYDGRVLKAARILTIGETQVQVLHSGGMEGVPVDQVPLDVLARAQMALEKETRSDAVDPQEVALIARQNDRDKAAEDLGRQNARFRAALADVTITAGIKIVQVLPDGVLAKGTGFVGVPRVTERKRVVNVKGTGLKSHTTEPRVVVSRDVERTPAGLPPLFFVQMRTQGLADGQSLGLEIWPIGSYAYTNTLGARATVQRYTTDHREYLDTLRPAIPPAPEAKKTRKVVFE